MTAAGLFVRQTAHIGADAYADAGPRLACLPVLDTHRRPLNRGREWWQQARARGVQTMGFDWLPPGHDAALGGIEEACAFLASVGGSSFVTDPELHFKGRPELAGRYAAACRAACRRHGLRYGMTSYSLPSYHRTFPWAELLEGTDFAIPQAYDRDHELQPGYHERAILEYRERGATQVILGMGAYRRREGGGWRWRRPDEIHAHAALAPASYSQLWWPLAGEPPAEVLAAIAQAAGKATPLESASRWALVAAAAKLLSQALGGGL